MTLFAAAGGGSRITKANQSTFATAYTLPDPYLLITADVYEAVPLDGAAPANLESARRVKFKVGQIVRQSQIDAAYVVPTNIKIAIPLGATTVAAAGGTVITITADRGMLGVTGVTFGGTAGTAVTVVDDKTITVAVPAKVAGPYAVVIQDDSSATVAAGNITYV